MNDKENNISRKLVPMREFRKKGQIVSTLRTIFQPKGTHHGE